ncbi:MAG: RIP metalloprotease RseP [Thermoanaerobaculia bacterium]|nr:MAG: RIP metalloprotease RseP [Thermoanaerobaculia bacterium]
MFDFLTSALAFIFAIGVIIFVHELGHFAVAKAFGMRVLAFSLGFGKRLWGFRRGETEYKIAVLPLGGYVKLSGEEDAAPSDDPRDFGNRPRWQRILVYLAGPAMNAALSILLIAVLFTVGIEVPALQSIPSVVGSVEPGSPGEQAGLASGDRIVAIDGREVERWHDVAFAVMTSIGRPLRIEVERDGSRSAVTVTPVKPPDFDFGDIGVFPKILPRVGSLAEGSPAAAAGLALGDEIRAVDGRPLGSSRDLVEYIEPRAGQTVVLEVLRAGMRLEIPVVPADQGGKGKIGVGLTIEQRFPPLTALAESVRFNWTLARQSLEVIGKIFKREVAAKSALAGPIEIAAQSGAAARSGVKDLLYLMGVISISIGLLNLFPIPVLDGGQITILLVESVLRRDLSETVKMRVAQVGLALVVLLMATVLWFDLSKQVSKLFLPE